MSQREPFWPAQGRGGGRAGPVLTLPGQADDGPQLGTPGSGGDCSYFRSPSRRPTAPRISTCASGTRPWRWSGQSGRRDALALVLLVHYLLQGGRATGGDLLVSAVTIWLTNVLVFALWYWELDQGGPGSRAASRSAGDFRFPQQQTGLDRWAPAFVDYLYLSFTNATALSPTDTVPLSAWAKLLMMLQALVSLLTLVLVAAHAVNVLG